MFHANILKTRRFARFVVSRRMDGTATAYSIVIRSLLHNNEGTDMTILTKTLTTLVLALTTLSASASADTYHHIDQLALSIDRKSQQLRREIVHYRHTPEYTHLSADTRELGRLAKHMHEVAHHHGSLAHLQADLKKLDSVFHHMEATFEQTEAAAAHGHGHIHGSTSHVGRLLHSVEDDIHHLQDDVRSLRAAEHHFDAPSHYSPLNSFHRSHSGHSSHWSGSRSRGISIGGGSSRFTIRF